MTEPLTPVQIEQKLRALVNAISKAQGELRDARLAEAEAEEEFERAKVRASYSPDCPVVKRGAVTVAEREEWIDAQTINEAGELRHRRVLREIAMDALRSRIAESQAVQSLNASVRQAYSQAGVS